MPPKKGNIRDKVRALREKNAAAGAVPSANASVASAGTEPRGESRGEQAAGGAGPSDDAAQQAGAKAAAAHRTEVPSLSAMAQLAGQTWACACTVRVSVRLCAHAFTVWGWVGVCADTSVALRHRCFSGMHVRCVNECARAVRAHAHAHASVRACAHVRGEAV